MAAADVLALATGVEMAPVEDVVVVNNVDVPGVGLAGGVVDGVAQGAEVTVGIGVVGFVLAEVAVGGVVLAEVAVGGVVAGMLLGAEVTVGDGVFVVVLGAEVTVGDGAVGVMLGAEATVGDGAVGVAQGAEVNIGDGVVASAMTGEKEKMTAAQTTRVTAAAGYAMMARMRTGPAMSLFLLVTKNSLSYSLLKKTSGGPIQIGPPDVREHIVLCGQHLLRRCGT